MLQAKCLGVNYGAVRALVDVSFTIHPGDSIAVMGPSGSGKTTVLHCASGLLNPHRGTVIFNGVEMGSLKDRGRAAIRLRNFGFIFQRADLIAEMTLLENIMLPLRVLGEKPQTCSIQATSLARELGIDDCMQRKPALVSGGQRQRAAIARALIARPSIIFADEPTGALDSVNREGVLQLISQQCLSTGAALLMVTHDPDTARICQQQWRMHDGQLLNPPAQRVNSKPTAHGRFT
ncbi:spectrin beta chain, non-erythrocytic 4-like [Platysternon megacephalum]|uniref:Spectrin beta chain, non-erythrocytic 4-like n=1 Tax=Platysternon megacephalum TaxID=55544 RepID=A0A4D9DGF9_9SAUR|nr:spectrin beta chain, non-erythrocytic 4-like [Platysternon megacephalum]